MPPEVKIIIKNRIRMEFIGNLKQLVGERSGDGQNGPWRINQYLLETVDMFPKRMVVEVRDNIALWDTLIGKNVLIKFNIDAREWQGKWFNSLRAYSIEEYTQETEQKRRSRRMPKPTGEIEGAADDAAGTVVEGAQAFEEHVTQTSPEQKDVDWDKMGQNEQKPVPNGTGTVAGGEKDDDLPF